jgi:hypothetical protein
MKTRLRRAAGLILTFIALTVVAACGDDPASGNPDADNPDTGDTGDSGDQRDDAAVCGNDAVEGAEDCDGDDAVCGSGRICTSGCTQAERRVRRRCPQQPRRSMAPTPATHVRRDLPG